ncbi:MAG TPA: hypothetical protein VIK33_04840 [Anaerolineae bacterium]
MVGGPDVDARLELMHYLGDAFQAGGLGLLVDADIVQFDATSLGFNAVGRFSLCFGITCVRPSLKQLF